MRIETEQRGTSIILRPSGHLPKQLDFALRDAVASAVTGGSRHVVLDLGNLQSIDSLGIGEIVAAYTAARTRDASIALARLSPKVEQVISTSNLDSIFTVYSDVDTAVSAAN